MPEGVVAQSAAFPIAWWLSWFVVASLVYGLLAIWFWRAGRRHDKAVSGDDGAPK